jgi:heme o synthase
MRQGPGWSGAEPRFFFSRVRVIARLAKINVALTATLSAASGYVVCLGGMGSGIVTSVLGTLLVAMGSCALNQFQERDRDARMQRTRERPIPSGELKPITALRIAALLVVSGLLLLAMCHGSRVALTALLAVFLYNGFYTYLKRIWPFAALPGALVGSLPPMIGWMAAGGKISDARIIALAFFFFLWQVPHFWLLLSIYDKDYESAGLPSMTRVFGSQQRARLTFIWLLTAAASALLLPLYRIISSPWICFALIACCFWLAGKSVVILRKHLAPQSLWLIFRSTNVFAFCVMGCLVMDVLMSVR